MVENKDKNEIKGAITGEGKINNSDLDQLQKLWTKHKPEDDKVIQLFSDRKKALTERK